MLALKGNQSQLHKAVAKTFSVKQAEGFEGCDHDCHKTVNKNHGRIEARRCQALGTPEYTWYAAPNKTWPDLHSLAMIEAQRHQGEQVVSGTRYNISGLPADARALLQAVRSHWGVENRLHWGLDMTFREDQSRIRTSHAAHNMSILRPLALNLLRLAAMPSLAVVSRRNRPAGTTGTCSRCCQIRVRLPYPASVPGRNPTS